MDGRLLKHKFSLLMSATLTRSQIFVFDVSLVSRVGQWDLTFAVSHCPIGDNQLFFLSPSDRQRFTFLPSYRPTSKRPTQYAIVPTTYHQPSTPPPEAVSQRGAKFKIFGRSSGRAHCFCCFTGPTYLYHCFYLRFLPKLGSLFYIHMNNSKRIRLFH